MDTRGLTDCCGRRLTAGLVLLVAHAFGSGCASWRDHKDYFAEMAAAMPACGRLWLDSEVNGMTARYAGPGLIGKCMARLVDVRYSQRTQESEGQQYALLFSFASPVRLCEDTPLPAFVEIADERNAPVQVSELFKDVQQVQRTDACQSVIRVAVTKRADAPSGTYKVRLRRGSLSTCCGCGATGTVRLKIP